MSVARRSHGRAVPSAPTNPACSCRFARCPGGRTSTRERTAPSRRRVARSGSARGAGGPEPMPRPANLPRREPRASGIRRVRLRAIRERRGTRHPHRSPGSTAPENSEPRQSRRPGLRGPEPPRGIPKFPALRWPTPRDRAAHRCRRQGRRRRGRRHMRGMPRPTEQPQRATRSRPRRFSRLRGRGRAGPCRADRIPRPRGRPRRSRARTAARPCGAARPRPATS